MVQSHTNRRFLFGSEQNSGCEGTHASYGTGGEEGNLWNLDHENHGVFGLVAEGAANDIHSMLMSDSLQTLTVHGQQLVPSLQTKRQVKMRKTKSVFIHQLLSCYQMRFQVKPERIVGTFPLMYAHWRLMLVHI